VIANPPTTLKVAAIMAAEPKTFSIPVVANEKRIQAPSIVTAEMALVMDINGV